jgi:uncharacterized membrane protein
MLPILIFFCVYSVMGWAVDTAYRSVHAGRYKPGGFSKAPFSPIYGFAGLFIVAVAPSIAGWHLLLQWAFFTVVLGAFEYVGGAVTHRVFKRRLWDYRRDPWDLHGYTGPQFAAAWGALALVIAHAFHPFLVRLLSSISL